MIDFIIAGYIDLYLSHESVILLALQKTRPQL